MRNHFYSEQRRAWRRNEVCVEDAGVSVPRQAAQAFAVALSEVYEALHTLPDNQREALILVGAGGFSYEEAAQICGCALGTVKSRVSRARVTLSSIVRSDVRTRKRQTDGSGAMEKLLDDIAVLSARPRAI